VLAWLDDHDVAYSVSDALVARQVGGGHRVDGSETATLLIRGGSDTLAPHSPEEKTLGIELPLGTRDAEWYRTTTAALPDALAKFVSKLAADPGLAARTLTAVGAAQGPASLTNRPLRAVLCGIGTSIRTRATEFERDVIDLDSRLRWCSLDAELEAAAVSISIGPADTAR